MLRPLVQLSLEIVVARLRPKRPQLLRNHLVE
jgi:hypothetical protein